MFDPTDFLSFDVLNDVQNDVKLGKEKVKRKHAIVVRQEEELQAREQALSSALRELQGLTAAVDAARAERGALGSENSELRAKLEESKAQLQSNEQMIRWLNQQVGAPRDICCTGPFAFDSRL